MVGAGVAVASPSGYGGFVLPRSGLAMRHGVTCLNTPGLIDAGYRDELRVLLVNTDPDDDYEVHRGDRIAQLVIQRVEHARFEPVAALDPTDRGTGGRGAPGRAGGPGRWGTWVAAPPTRMWRWGARGSAASSRSPAAVLTRPSAGIRSRR